MSFSALNLVDCYFLVDTFHFHHIVWQLLDFLHVSEVFDFIDRQLSPKIGTKRIHFCTSRILVLTHYDCEFSSCYYFINLATIQILWYF